jgi:hypothetical protein
MACTHPITREFLEQTYEEVLRLHDRFGTPRKPTDLVGGPFYTIYKMLVWPPMTYEELWNWPPSKLPRIVRRENSEEQPDPLKRWFV